jgi:GNAT superfamily N-acetyltransferase
MDATTIRPASPDEIDEAVAIDDDACRLFATVGLDLEIGPDHPFAQAERARWLAAMKEGSAYFAESSTTVGLLVLGVVEGARYVEQLSVRMGAMRRGIGRALLKHAIAWADREPLWLTTYAHVRWNRAYYEQHGFVLVPEQECPRGIVATLDEERQWLPAPAQRIAMRWIR